MTAALRRVTWAERVSGRRGSGEAARRTRLWKVNLHVLLGRQPGCSKSKEGGVEACAQREHLQRGERAAAGRRTAYLFGQRRKSRLRAGGQELEGELSDGCPAHVVACARERAA